VSDQTVVSYAVAVESTPAAPAKPVIPLKPESVIR